MTRLPSPWTQSTAWSAPLLWCENLAFRFQHLGTHACPTLSPRWLQQQKACRLSSANINAGYMVLLHIISVDPMLRLWINSRFKPGTWKKQLELRNFASRCFSHQTYWDGSLVERGNLNTDFSWLRDRTAKKVNYPTIPVFLPHVMVFFRAVLSKGKYLSLMLPCYFWQWKRNEGGIYPDQLKALRQVILNPLSSSISNCYSCLVQHYLLLGRVCGTKRRSETLETSSIWTWAEIYIKKLKLIHLKFLSENMLYRMLNHN